MPFVVPSPAPAADFLSVTNDLMLPEAIRYLLVVGGLGVVIALGHRFLAR